MRRVFNYEVDTCPKCKSPMTRVTAIMKPDVIRKILEASQKAADSPKAT